MAHSNPYVGGATTGSSYTAPAQSQSSGGGLFDLFGNALDIFGNSGSSSGGGFLSSLNPFSSFLGGGSSAAGAGASGAGAGGSGMFGGLGSALFSNPITGIVGAALAGATSLSADSVAAGNSGNELNWLGPLYNIPEAIARGNWDDAMKDGAWGPIGAIYNIANGKDVGRSIANSLGPLGQVPYLLFGGELPYSGGKSSYNFINAFTGRGI